jgi:hypothetical protein
MIDHPRDDGRYGHNKGNRQPHGEGRVDFLADSQERTDSQEVKKNKVLDQNSRDKQDNQFQT